MKSKGVILFHPTSSAIRAEKVVFKKGFSFKLIPTPRELSSDCGISLRFELESKDSIIELLQSDNVEFASVHEI